MAGSKKKTEAQEEQKNKQETIKASVGAWWKSTATEESETKDPTLKKTDGKKATGKAGAKKTPGAKSSRVSSEEDGGGSASSRIKTDRAPAVQAADTAGEPKSSPSQRKRQPRKNARPAAAQQSALAVEVVPQEKTEDKPVSAENETAPLDEKAKKPRRKRPPRRKKPIAKVDEGAAQQDLTGEVGVGGKSGSEGEATASPAETAALLKPGEERRKPGRKRSPRKKKNATVAKADNAETVADLAVTEKVIEEIVAEQTATEADAAPGSEAEAKPVSKQKRGGRRGRRSRKRTQDKDKAAGDELASQESESGDEDDFITDITDDAADDDLFSDDEDFERDEDDDEVDEVDDQKIDRLGPKPVIKLLINAEEPEECRLAILEDGRLESIHVATSTRTQTKNNIYKAKIVAIEPNLQAAFVDYGTDKNGFLPFSEIHPEYYKQDVIEKVQKLIDQQQWKKLSITDVVDRGREVLVQVVKEEVGKKGANMTTFLSIPGRCVVLMPGSDSTGISRKILGEERRTQLRDYIQSIDIPEGIGWIVRTASIDITKTALSRDVNYLIKLWEDIKKKGQELDGVGLVYQDHDHVLRFLREHFDPDIQEILVDSEEALEQVEGFVELLPAKQRNVRVKLHRGARPIFNQYSIEDQIESIYQPRVNLPSGGSIVIDPTEALVAIDVNSGSTSKGQNFEETIFQANMEAAKELARQLRLRDLGGLIVIDFIDMRFKKNIREVERQVKLSMKRDKAKVDISRISKFGLMQISRQKLGAPIEAGNYRVCAHCKGRGIVRSVETLALFYLRRIHTGATRKNIGQIECRFPLDVAQYLLNNKRQEIRDLEKKYGMEVMIVAVPSFKPADNEIIFHKAEKDEAVKKRS